MARGSEEEELRVLCKRMGTKWRMSGPFDSWHSQGVDYLEGVMAAWPHTRLGAPEVTSGSIRRVLFQELYQCPDNLGTEEPPGGKSLVDRHRCLSYAIPGNVFINVFDEAPDI